MDLYILFHEIALGGNIDTLYKVELPAFDEIKTEESSELLTPMLELPKDKYPFSMGCVHFNSKVYFFGGLSRHPFEIEENRGNVGRDFTADVYPCDAYVLDLTDDDLVLNRVPSMKTGKPSTFGFVAGGMIYVIGGKVRRSFRFSDDKIKCFERFNPASMTWQVLDDTPLRGLCQCVGASVVENQHKVLISGWKDADIVFLVYDFFHGTWDSENLLISPDSGRKPYTINHISASDFNGQGHYLYGLRPCATSPLPIKLGPLKELEVKQIRKLSKVDVSTHDGRNIRGVFRLIGRLTLNEMVYLSDGHFCYVGTAQHLPGDFGDDFCGPCPQIRNMYLTIFKDLSNPVAIQQEGSSFEAKILSVKNYVMNTNSYGGFNIGSCFVASHDCTSVTSRGSRHQPRCFCNKIAPIRVVKCKGPNYGRRFFGCINYPDHCGFMKWEDQVSDIEDLQLKILEKDTIIAGMEFEKEELLRTFRRFKARKEVVVEDEMKELVKQIAQLHNEFQKLMRFGLVCVVVIVILLFLK